eukprot:c10036_g1_i1.p1 GENE.c10036_g1_i1~~c10036_g1_i1.p1  ORF type:complete len:184 (-),score=19.18 c10036_g1_i1:14-565(-)
MMMLLDDPDDLDDVDGSSKIIADSTTSLAVCRALFQTKTSQAPLVRRAPPPIFSDKIGFPKKSKILMAVVLFPKSTFPNISAENGAPWCVRAPLSNHSLGSGRETGKVRYDAFGETSLACMRKGKSLGCTRASEHAFRTWWRRPLGCFTRRAREMPTQKNKFKKPPKTRGKKNSRKSLTRVYK